MKSDSLDNRFGTFNTFSNYMTPRQDIINTDDYSIDKITKVDIDEKTLSMINQNYNFKENDSNFLSNF